MIVVVTLPCIWFLYQAIAGSLALIDIGRIQSSPCSAVPDVDTLSLAARGLGYFGLEFVLAMVDTLAGPQAARVSRMTLTLSRFSH